MSNLWLPLTLLLFGCTREEYRNADLQLDILAPQPSWADRVRICAEGVLTRTMGAGDGSYALPGLPADRPVTVAVQLLVDPLGEGTDDTGHDGPLLAGSTAWVGLSGDTPWLEADLELFAHSAQAARDCVECPPPCQTENYPAASEEESWLLVTRFQD